MTDSGADRTEPTPRGRKRRSRRRHRSKSDEHSSPTSRVHCVCIQRSSPGVWGQGKKPACYSEAFACPVPCPVGCESSAARIPRFVALRSSGEAARSSSEAGVSVGAATSAPPADPSGVHTSEEGALDLSGSSSPPTAIINSSRTVSFASRRIR